MNKIKFKTLIVCFIIIVFSALSVNYSVFADDDDELARLQKEYEQLEKKQQQLNKELNQVKKEKNQQQQIKEKVDQQIRITEQQIETLEKKIAKQDADIAAKEKSLEQKQKDISAIYEKFKKRLRANYMSDRATGIEALINSKDFADMLVRYEHIIRINNYDKNLLDTLRQEKNKIEEEKKLLEKARAEIKNSYSMQSTKYKQLESQFNESSNLINSLQKDEQKYLSHLRELQRQRELIDAEIAAIIEKYKALDKYVGGEFAWPVPGYYSISSPYGIRVWGSGSNRWTEFHTGTDIAGAGIYGKNIVAANSGRVITVQDYGNYGYGRLVVLDHGGGYTTRYAHCSSILVSVNQTVTKGQVIARVGSTGNSTGPHLHFEIRINNQHIDPMSKFK